MGQSTATAPPRDLEADSAGSGSEISTPSSDSDTSHTSRFLSQSYRASPPGKQRQLLIHAPKEPFKLEESAELPDLKHQHEVLIRVDSIGLNPIDWKSPAFGFGLPSLPCVLGRDYVGTVVKVPDSEAGKPLQRSLQPGDVVLAISTDYRDYRKAAFQQYSVASNFNVCRVPTAFQHSSTFLSAIGVAYITATISLSVCLGLDFGSVAEIPGPNLRATIQQVRRNTLSEDIREEVFDSLPAQDHIQPGDWIAVWGASSTVGFFTVQLAKKAGLKVVAVADLTKNYASSLVDIGADVLVHRAIPEETVKIIKSLTAGKGLRYGVDTVGKETSALLQSTFQPQSKRPHLVCLVGQPKELPEGCPSATYHKLPMKLFHESPEIGQALMEWLEDLLASGGLMMPKVEVHHSKGLQNVNEALERLRVGEIDGHRLVLAT